MRERCLAVIARESGIVKKAFEPSEVWIANRMVNRIVVCLKDHRCRS